ncbi:MAG: sensor histidine kinase, partial [Phycisphaerae bacterium]
DYPVNLWHSSGRKVKAGELIGASELLSDYFEPWLMGHFTVSDLTDWSSPQTEFYRISHLPDAKAPDPATVAKAMAMLQKLRRNLTPQGLGRKLALARTRDRRLAGGDAEDPNAPPRRADAFDPELFNPDTRAGLNSAAQPALTEYRHRRWQMQQVLRRAPEVCDPRDRAQILLDRMPHLKPDPDSSVPTESLVDAALADTVEFWPSGFTGVWLNLGNRAAPDLAFVRTVLYEDQVVYQGFVIDWSQLKPVLLAKIEDLFPWADLLPVGNAAVDDPESLMDLLPVRLDISAVAAAPLIIEWSPMRTGLLIAWIAALIVLIAAGFGVRGLLALAERRSQFAYAVSHELRTPLTTFRLYTDMLADGIVPEHKRQHYLNTLNEESQRLTQLVGGVLEYSQLEHHSIQPTRVATTVGQVLESARDRFEPQCAQTDHRLVIDVNGLAETHWQTDPDITLQIIGTLIDNACKYALDPEDPRIVVSASNARGGQITIEVRDFGPGVPKKERRGIFKPFRRGRRTSTTTGGIGLGLALAHRWAQVLGGKLELANPQPTPKGASFRLTLPG